MTELTTHIVLLRGINVGTHNRIPMAELRELLTGLGYAGVRTLLNSGNAVVTTSTQDPAVLARQIQAAISDRFALSIHTVVRNRAQVKDVIRRNPMPEQAEQAPKLFHVGFCDPSPLPGSFDAIDAAKLGADQLVVDGATLYLWFADGVIGSPLGKALAAHPLNGTVTLRNWNTVRKLHSLADPCPAAGYRSGCT